MLSLTGAAGAQSLPAPAAPNFQRNAGPLERVLEGLPLPSNKPICVTWHCLTARLRAAPTSNKAQRQTKPPKHNAPARAAAQRQRPRRRLPPDTRAVHEAVQLGRRSCGANRRGNEGLFKTGDREGRRAHVQHVSRTVPLTVKLRGRLMPQAVLTSNEALQSRRARPIKRRGRTISSSARGAGPLGPHGPLQRLLDARLCHATSSEKPSIQAPKNNAD